MARRGGLGKGLGALIPTGAAEGRRRRWLQRDPGRGDPSRTRTSRGSTSTRRRSARWPSRSARSACSSRSSCAPVGRRLRADRRRAPLARRPPGRPADRSRRSSATADDAAALEQALVENLQRAGPQPARGGGRLPAADRGLRPHPRARWRTRVGKSRATVTNTLRLLQLPPSIQRYVQDGAALDGPRPGAARHARPGVPGAARRDAPSTEDLSVRAVEEAVRGPHGRPAPERRAPTRDAGRRSRCGRRVCSSSRSCSATTSRPG